MILIVTNREDYTADFLIIDLQRRNTRYRRLNTEDLPCRATLTWRAPAVVSDDNVVLPSGRLQLSEVHSIWYRRPALPALSPELTDSASVIFASVETEAALDGVLRTIDCLWVSDPDRVRRAENKPLQLAVAARVGFSLPDTLITNDPADARAFVAGHARTIYKPLRHGRIVEADKLRLVYTNIVDDDAVDWSSVAFAPCLFQAYVSKDVEVRATVIGDRVLCAAIHSQDSDVTRHDWRRPAPDGPRHEPHDLPEDVSRRCISLVGALGLSFGAIDLIRTPAGEYVFLEINPNGQWAWIQQLCPEIPLRETLADLLEAGSRA
jgi:glutathione synthase/RimK-type ligase-like ATP-grasp enzyme